MQALGHRVVGDTLYGAPARLRGLDPEPEPGQELEPEHEPAAKQKPAGKRKTKQKQATTPDPDPELDDPQEASPAGPKPTLTRNFLHAARLVLAHPTTGKRLDFEAPLPPELEALLERLRSLEDQP